MRSIFVASLALVLATAALASPNYPFPQNVKAPYGNTYLYAETDSIKVHFEKWLNVWYTTSDDFYALSKGSSTDANAGMPDNTARVISPGSDAKLTVSEAIAYGMLLTVYMSSSSDDYQTEFDKLWRFWKCYGYNLDGNGCDSWSGQGMEWEINAYDGSVEGSGTASDAEFDAAVALVMAYKQWGDETYLSNAKSLIDWIQDYDMNSDGTIRPGSNWNDAFNPSYAHIAAFQLFYDITGESFWQTAISQATSYVIACQDETTGLMPDWCDWDSHEGIKTSATVSSGYIGMFADAARTPWRMAWGYYWYGISAAKTSNDMIIDWLDSATYGYAGLTYPGYYVDGTSPIGWYVSSTYAGGLGLSMATADDPGYYLETVYEVLSNLESLDSLRSNQGGEAYFASTLNILYLLLLTGNMPNFYDMTGYTSFTPDPDGWRLPSAPEGTLMEVGSGATVAGYELWGSYCDKYGKTTMYPDSGSTAIYLQSDGTYIIATEFRVGSEPTYYSNKDLLYPFAGIAVSFDSLQQYYDLSALNSITITYKSQGVIRFALLDYATIQNEEEGGEPGMYLQPREDWTTFSIDISGDDSDVFNTLTYPTWRDIESERSVVLANVRGFKFDAGMSKGGYGSFALKELALYDSTGSEITTLTLSPIQSAAKVASSLSLAQRGTTISYNGFGSNAKLKVYNLKGAQVKAMSVPGSGNLDMSQLANAKGVYLLQLTGSNGTKTIKAER